MGIGETTIYFLFHNFDYYNKYKKCSNKSKQIMITMYICSNNNSSHYYTYIIIFRSYSIQNMLELSVWVLFVCLLWFISKPLVIGFYATVWYSYWTVPFYYVMNVWILQNLFLTTHHNYSWNSSEVSTQTYDLPLQLKWIQTLDQTE